MNAKNNHYLRSKIILKDSRIFKKIKGNGIDELLALMGYETWTKGTFKNNADFGNTYFYLILYGRVKMYQINPITGRSYTISIFNVGDCFDILGLMDVAEHNVYFEALDDIELLCVTMQHLREWMKHHPEVNVSLLQYMGKRMCQLEEAASAMCLNNTLSRLVNLLLKDAEASSKRITTIKDLPNTEIADILGTTRAVINRNIQELKGLGAIAVKRRHIEIVNKKILKNISASIRT